jgi:hypothetical protein
MQAMPHAKEVVLLPGLSMRHNNGPQKMASPIKRTGMTGK